LSSRPDPERPPAKIYPLHSGSDGRRRQQLHEIKSAFTAEYLAFFLLALDTSTRVGGITPRGLKVMQRAYDLLLEARNEFEREFAG
jgi:hypothetical protein